MAALAPDACTGLHSPQEAEHDVTKVYMEVIPERSALPAIAPAPLVQAKEPTDLLEAAGPDLFDGLVPPQVRPAAARPPQGVALLAQRTLPARIRSLRSRGGSRSSSPTRRAPLVPSSTARTRPSTRRFVRGAPPRGHYWSVTPFLQLAGWGLPAAVQGGEGASSIPDAMWREIQETQRKVCVRSGTAASSPPPCPRPPADVRNPSPGGP